MKTVTVPVAFLNRIYATAYERGHNDTVEAAYTYILQQDVETYFSEEVDEMLAAAQQEDQRESPSNPSPSTGQSKQGLTSSHDGAPTPKQPSDAERLADMERQNRDQLAEIILLEKEIAALRAKDK
jgi:hypothetical protein